MAKSRVKRGDIYPITGEMYEAELKRQGVSDHMNDVSWQLACIHDTYPIIWMYGDIEAISALAALAQTTRLDTFRLLVARSPKACLPANSRASWPCRKTPCRRI